MQTRIEALTDVGAHRSQNEDWLLVDHDAGLVIVADGVGGARAGDYASRLGAESVADRLLNQLQTTADGEQQILTALADAVSTAHQWITDAAQGEDRLKGMASTLLALLIRESSVHVAHVGDSRLYHLRDRDLKQLTRDQTMAWQLVADGYLNPEDVPRSKYRNVLTQALGGGTEPIPELFTVTVGAGERLLVCSDGLSDMLDDEAIRNTLLAQPKPCEAVQALIAAANAAGGLDNITVGIIEFEG